MADFRIPFVPDYRDSYCEYELDWNKESRIWTLSEREVGSSHWVEGMTPSDKDLTHLFLFFHINNSGVMPKNVMKLSPGELVLMHKNYSDKVSIFGFLCTLCARHWYIFRWEKNSWAIYGRTCDFSWKRGSQPNDDEIQILGKLRGQTSSPLVPPM